MCVVVSHDDSISLSQINVFELFDNIWRDIEILGVEREREREREREIDSL